MEGILSGSGGLAVQGTPTLGMQIRGQCCTCELEELCCGSNLSEACSSDWNACPISGWSSAIQQELLTSSTSCAMLCGLATMRGM